MTDSWDAFFRLASAEWAPLWSSLFEGGLTALVIWLISQIDPTRTSAFEFTCFSLIHVCRFIFAVVYGFEDDWPGLSATECYGRTIVVSPFLVAIYTAYYEQGESWTRDRADRVEKS